MPPRISFDNVARIYDETRGHQPRVMARLLGTLVDELQGKDLLEIGVGTGRYAVPLQKSGVRVVGIDFSRKMMEIGLAKGLRDIVFADGARLPFAAKSFDVTMTSHVLHLVPDWRDVLLEVTRVTRESYMTIAERTHRAESVKREYDRLVREAGHHWSAPGLHERDMPDLLPPDIVMPVGTFEETIAADALLAELDGRSYSSQWEVPEEIHRKAMSALRQAWGGKELNRSYSLEVLFWRVERLPEIPQTVPQTS